MKKEFVLVIIFAISAILISCGGGGNPNTSSSQNSNTTTASTNQIKSYMNLAYSNSLNYTDATYTTLLQQLENSGTTQSSMYVLGTAALKERQAQYFLNLVVPYIQNISTSSSIDKAAIANELSIYQNQDLQWYPTFVSNNQPSQISPMPLTSPSYINAINLYYATALASINAL